MAIAMLTEVTGVDLKGFDYSCMTSLTTKLAFQEYSHYITRCKGSRAGESNQITHKNKQLRQ